VASLNMRTTLRLDDDVIELVRSYSELVRRGLSAPAKTRVVNGLVVFDVPRDSERITTEFVKRLEAKES